jgi:hypothetical protein
MKYLCLVYVEEKTLNALSRDERVALSDESMAYCDGLQKKRSTAWGLTPSSGRGRDDGAGARRESLHDRRALRRNEGTVGRVPVDRCSGPQRRRTDRVEVSRRSVRQYRSAAD